MSEEPRPKSDESERSENLVGSVEPSPVVAEVPSSSPREEPRTPTPELASPAIDVPKEHAAESSSAEPSPADTSPAETNTEESLETKADAPPVAGQSAPGEEAKPGKPPAKWYANVFGAFHSALDSAASISSRITLAFFGYFFIFLIAGFGFGSLRWCLKNPNRLPDVYANKLNYTDQLAVLKLGLQSLGGLVVLGFLVVIGVSVLRRRLQFTRPLSEVSSWALIPAAAPAVLACFVPQIETAHAIFTLVFSVIATAALTVFVYRAFPERWSYAEEFPQLTLGSEKARSVAAFLAVALLWAAYGGYFSYLSITNHHGLATRTTDLGYYDNIFFQTSHGRFLGCSFIKAEYHGSAHFDPILAVLSPLYRFIYPHAEFLLVLQSVWIGAGVIPVYLIGRRSGLSRVIAFVLAFAFAIHPAVHGANMYEFHSLTLLMTPLLFALYALDADKWILYLIVLTISLLVREDVALVMLFVGTAAMARYQGRRRILGFVTIIAGLGYFALAKLKYMTSPAIFSGGSADSYGFSYYYDDLTKNGKGFGGFLLSIVTNPIYIVTHVLTEAKVQFALTVFLPLLLLPLLSRKGRFMILYGLIFIMLATRTAVFSVHFQYTATLVPVLFALAPDGLQRLRTSPRIASLGLSPVRLGRALAAGVFVSSVLITLKFGGIVENSSFRGGFSRVVRKLTNDEKQTYQWIKATTATIPISASVGTTEKLGPHVSNRMHAYIYSDSRKNYDYVFLDEKELKSDKALEFRQAVQRGLWVEVARKGSLILCKYAPEKKAAAPEPREAPAEPDIAPDDLGPDPPDGQPEER